MLLRDWLCVHKITPFKFARAVGVSPANVYRILRGKQRASIKMAMRIEIGTRGVVSRVEAIWPDYEAPKHVLESIANRRLMYKIEDQIDMTGDSTTSCNHEKPTA